MSSGVPALAATVDCSYDTLGRLTNVINADGSSISYTYDPAGNRTQVVRVLFAEQGSGLGQPDHELSRQLPTAPTLGAEQLSDQRLP